MGKFIVLAMLIGACGGMYTDRAEPMHSQKPVPPPPPVPVDDPLVGHPVYTDDCDVNFHAPNTAVRRDQPAAQRLVTVGNTDLAQTDAAKTVPVKERSLEAGLTDYAKALAKDPYDADATVGLAVAYDRAWKKGCALALLKRLDALAANPKFAGQVKRSIDRILDNPDWFKAYRKDALRAAGATP